MQPVPVSLGAVCRLAVLLASAVLFCTAALAYPPVYMEKAETTPDMVQTDQNARLPARGMAYCGPVAVSNSLVWLSRHGYAELIPPLDKKRTMTQAQLASLLALEKYMDTSLKHGTSPAELLEGLEKFLADRGFSSASLKYQGWRSVPERFIASKGPPSMDWIKKGLLGDSAVWLNVGWYDLDKETKTFHRRGGHWVTLVGYGKNAAGKPDPFVLAVHDPATRRKPGKDKAPRRRHDFVVAEPIASGTLAGKIKPLPVDAAGYYILGGELHVQHDADYALLDGAVVLTLQPGKKTE
ncbi:MAG: hypothetical protein JRI97_06535 [Deltaproteobacteria bacterium]|nr:hypothetical protein [Deltaproteobacteria bacterium]